MEAERELSDNLPARETREIKEASISKPTLLEQVLQLHGKFRRNLVPLRVPPLQAGMFLYLHRHGDAKLKDAAAAVNVKSPTLGMVITDLVRKRWVTKQRVLEDDRALSLQLSQQGKMLARRILDHVRDVKGLDVHA